MRSSPERSSSRSPRSRRSSRRRSSRALRAEGRLYPRRRRHAQLGARHPSGARARRPHARSDDADPRRRDRRPALFSPTGRRTVRRRVSRRARRRRGRAAAGRVRPAAGGAPARRPERAAARTSARIASRRTRRTRSKTRWSGWRPIASRAPDGRVGVVGVSFAGGLALVAAGRASIARGCRDVVSLGGHADLPRVMTYLCTGICRRRDHAAARVRR